MGFPHTPFLTVITNIPLYRKTQRNGHIPRRCAVECARSVLMWFQAAPNAEITSCGHFAVTRITALKAESALLLTLLTALTL